jgi:ribose-phosphate pyrophosphokinase
MSRRGDPVPSELEIFAFPECQSLGRDLAAALDAPLQPVEVHVFPDRESLVVAKREREGPALLLRSLDDPNRKLVEVLLAADALRRQGAERIDLVAPYLGYMRQDRVFEPGQSLSQRVMANLLGQAFDDVLSVEAHLHRVRALDEIFSCPARSISAAPAITEWLRTHASSSLLIGPDSESEPWVRAIADAAGTNWSIAAKRRMGDREVRIDLPRLPAGLKSAWIIDDIGSSGSTLEVLARILKDRGVEEIGAIIVHALFDAEASARLRDAGITRLVSSDSVAHESNAFSLSGLLADSIEAGRRAREVA